MGCGIAREARGGPEQHAPITLSTPITRPIQPSLYPNPNPQIGPDDPRQQVLLDAFVQAASRPCFHELRTQQRLGYSVSLHSATIQRVLALGVRVQSPDTDPGVLQERVGAWLVAYRGQLEGMAAEELENHKRVRVCVGGGGMVGCCGAGVLWGWALTRVLKVALRYRDACPLTSFQSGFNQPPHHALHPCKLKLKNSNSSPFQTTTPPRPSSPFQTTTPRPFRTATWRPPNHCATPPPGPGAPSPAEPSTSPAGCAKPRSPLRSRKTV